MLVDVDEGRGGIGDEDADGEEAAGTISREIAAGVVCCTAPG